MNENEYSSHQEQVAECQPSPERIKKLEDSLIEAYEKVITYQEVPFIVFGDLNAEELAAAFVKYPIIIKPTLCCVNVAQRAVKRDLGFDLNTYSEKISETHAALLAGYIKPLLPPAIAVPALMELDRFFWTDKEMRARKGNWEKTVTLSINKASSQRFKKRKFECDGEQFEIDAACPAKGENIDIAIDIKRIESQRDIHKRADEIINKAQKFKKTYPQSRFIAVVYYPFPNQHLNLQNRLQSKDIEGVFFAGETESSIANVADMLVGTLGLKESNE
jgi:hypothetical protein